MTTTTASANTVAGSPAGHPASALRTAQIPLESANPLFLIPLPPCSGPFSEAESIDFRRRLGRLKELEGVWYEGSQLLLEIRDHDRDHDREHYTDFETFCRKELGMENPPTTGGSRRGKWRYSWAANVAKPEGEAHVRPLLRMSDPIQQIEAYREAVAQTKTDGKPLSAVSVTKAVREIHDALKPPDEGLSALSNGVVMVQISRSILVDWRSCLWTN